MTRPNIRRSPDRARHNEQRVTSITIVLIITFVFTKQTIVLNLSCSQLAGLLDAKTTLTALEPILALNDKFL